MANVGLRDLLESGVHFGHQTRKWDPKMKPYIFIARGGIYIIDLQKTLKALRKACAYIKETVSKGGSVMFVGTKKQAKVAIKEYAEKTGMPYITERWLGGMLTNYQTIHKSVQKLDEIEAMRADGRIENFSKKEQLEISRPYDKLNKNLGGIRTMKGLPAVLFIIDTGEEETAVREGNKLGIPIVGIVDTNCDPTNIDFPVPGNDDAIRAITLCARTVSQAIEEGKAMRSEGKETPVEMAEDKPEAKAAPKATLEGAESKVAPSAPAKPAEAPAAPAPASAPDAASAAGEAKDAAADSK